MTRWPYTEGERPRVVIAGGGVAALEACLFLRAYLDADQLEIELIAPEERFTYRPLAVLEPFEGPSRWSLALDRFAEDQDAALVRSRITRVVPGSHVVETTPSRHRPYDLLLVATGARSELSVPGALTFRSSADARGVRRLLDEAAQHDADRIVFAVPAGPVWALPLYELALLAAADLRRRGAGARLALVTAEEAPLALFGARASELVARLLGEHGIELVAGVAPVETDREGLLLADGRHVAADRVVAMPRLAGHPPAGVPRGPGGFVPVDEHGRVAGLEGVYAAGDITDFPFKQGSLAAQQADAAAEAMLAELGLPLAPRPFAPVVQGVLYSDGEAAYLRTPLGEPGGEEPEPSSYALWWPPSKIAGRFLSAYLTVRAGAPRAPEVRPTTDIVPVHVDVARTLEGPAA
jgi:sulfide:quinone oxidoreductase